jgi:alanine racemase
MSRPAKVLIDLGALRHNCQLANSLSPESKTMAIIKADAYGHGAIQVAQALEDLVPAFGVACIEEALELREAGIQIPIHLLEGAFSKDEIQIAANNNFSLAVVNHEQKKALLDCQLDKLDQKSQEAFLLKEAPIKVWLHVDSGMHRLGIQPDEVASSYQELAACSHIQDDIVIATHFACADDLENTFSTEQVRQFQQGLAALDLQNFDESLLSSPIPLSLANSAALLGWPETRAGWNRPGIMLFGSTPFSAPHKEADKLLPVMTFKSGVIALREIPPGETVGYAATWTAARPSRIATVAIGYGDGYPVHAPSGTPVLINGHRCPMVGRVSMDMITVDVTDLPDISLGDEVILWGGSLSANLSVNEVANCAGTISYELLTRMPRRTPREYIGH